MNNDGLQVNWQKILEMTEPRERKNQRSLKTCYNHLGQFFKDIEKHVKKLHAKTYEIS